MTLALLDIINAARDHALSTGWFDVVSGHEPKRAPGNGVSAAVWVEDVSPIPARSGLASTSARVELSVRCMTPMLAEPQDGIDPNLVGAADALMRAYTGDFTLGDLVANVDLLGSHGPGLRGRAGYLNQDQQLYRVFVITLPLVCNDLWDQVS